MPSTNLKLAISDSMDLCQMALPSILESQLNNVSVSFVVENLSELLMQLSNESVVPDIAIVEVKRPILDYCEKIMEMRKRYTDMKFIAVSDFENEYAIGQILKSGAVGFVKREKIVKELLACILVVQEDNFYLSGSLSFSVKKSLKNILHKDVVEFSEREKVFLKFCVFDYSLKEIAAKMHVSVRTVENYKDSLTKKLMIKSKTGLGIYAVQAGLV